MSHIDLGDLIINTDKVNYVILSKSGNWVIHFDDKGQGVPNYITLTEMQAALYKKHLPNKVNALKQELQKRKEQHNASRLATR